MLNQHSLMKAVVFQDQNTDIDLIVCFIAVLRHNNIISVISWWWYAVWDEEEKARVYTFTDSRDLPTPHRHGMTETSLWWCRKLYTARKWIATQLNVMAVVGFVPLSPRSPIRCLIKQSYLPHPCAYVYMCIYIYMCMCIYVYLCIYIYIYIV